MSQVFDAVRAQAVVIANEQRRLHVRETNSHLNNLVAPLENRGPQVDIYLRMSGVGERTMNSPTAQSADDRRWCGMFIYYCYQTAAQRLGQALPFGSGALQAGRYLRAWARRHEPDDLNSEPLFVWDNHATVHDPNSVQVRAGDIFSIGDGHIGMASGDSVNGRFPTIEGNQSELASRWEGIAQRHQNISNCSIIIRI